MKGDEENDEVVDVVEMEHGKPTEHCASPHQQTPETTAGETSRLTPPSQSELFLPSPSELYRCLPCRGKPVTLTGSALEVGESFLDQEESLLQRARWVVPPRATSSRALQESRPIRSSVAPQKTVEVKRQNTAHRDHSPAGATPVISASLRLPASVAVSQTDASSSDSRQCINPPEKSSLSSNGGRSRHTPSEVSSTLKTQTRENVLELSPRGPKILLKSKLCPQPREMRTQFSPQTTGREKQKLLESPMSGGSAVAVRGRRYEVPEVIDSSFFDHESQMEGSGGEGEREEPRVTLCSPSTQGSTSGQENPVEPCSTPQGPIISDRDNMASTQGSTSGQENPVEPCSTPQGPIISDRDNMARRGSSAVERQSISSPVEERNLQQPTGPRTLITTYCDNVRTAAGGSSSVDKGNSSVGVRNLQQPMVPPETSIATSTDLTSLLVISSVAGDGGESRGLSPTRRNLEGTLNSALEGRTEETSENEAVREEGERGARGEKEVRVSSGEKEMSRIREYNVKIPKLSVPTPTTRALRCRAEDANIAEVLSDLRLSLASQHCGDSLSEFHDFVLRLPLPSVRDAPTAGDRKTTRRPQKRKRTECKETNQNPISEDPLPSTSVSTLLTHLRDKPVQTGTGKESQADSWSSIDHLLDCLLPPPPPPPPPTPPPPRAPAAQEMREQRETESQRAACSENEGPHQRGNDPENGPSSHSDSDLQPGQSPSDRVRQAECPMHIKKIIHGFWFRHSIALTKMSTDHTTP
ncbi:hypothetical protein GBAR_LOCUS21744 [Geodia barretti]|uniref:Uncharacterized protein n=1 Tax=Geodia barretti TaxID=519541 RepID=A0AA35T165_GEOBA|nr:hypothetical protein GBAR_LOCUS21744 [Geodia barretti]